MGFFDLFKKKPTNSVGERLDRLTPEGELPFGWMAYNKELVKEMDDEWIVYRSAISDATDPSLKCAAMKSYLLYLEDGKNRYYEISECAGKYFEEYYCNAPYNDTIRKQFKLLKKQLKEV